MASAAKKPRTFINNNNNDTSKASASSHPPNLQQPSTLLDISARIVAQNIPFQYVEDNTARIPEPVENRIVFWSFPRNEKDIRLYSSFTRTDLGRTPFEEGELILGREGVSDALQIGFHLSGTVVQDENSFTVSITFDRCKISRVNCECSNKDIFWCCHIVALALYRMRMPEKIQVRSPISETLLQMDREQLQKFAQYLISHHHTQVLPTAQKLADDILETSSVINQLRGAPDPTAGAGLESTNSWHLDEDELRSQVKSNLHFVEKNYQCKHHQQRLTCIFNKVGEMLRRKDTNGSRMLSLITEEFLKDDRLILYKTQPMPDRLRKLWDEMACLWIYIVLNPFISESHRNLLRECFLKWMQVDGCPLEDAQIVTNNQNDNLTLLPSRSIFQRALDATSLPWTDGILKDILLLSSSKNNTDEEYKNVVSNSFPCWEENLTTSSARVNALRCHGYRKEARRLAVAVVRGVRRQICRRVQQHKQFVAGRSTSCECGYSTLAPYNVDTACMGNALNPIGCLFDSLIEVCLIEKQETDESRTTTYQHVDLFFNDNETTTTITDSYLTLAVEIAIFGLGQQRLKYSGYKESIARQHEKDLIQCLRKIPLDDRILESMKQQVLLMLDGGAGSSLECIIHPDSAPIHYFAKYLFQSFLPYDTHLAFKVGIRALRLPPTETEFTDDPINYIEQRQCELATALLVKADSQQLELVLRAVQTHMHSPSQIFSLAQQAYNESAGNSVFNDLKKAALNLGLMVLKKTKLKSHWRRSEMVRWVVKTAAPEAGDGLLINIGNLWENWLTAVEACQILAPVLINSSNKECNVKLAITVAMQCAADDPAHCALQALTMCEKDTENFSAAFQLIISAARRLPASQLFAIARYLDSRTQVRRAYQVALLALKVLRIAYNEDAHPAVSDIFWTCNLAGNLGKGELSQVVPILVENVHCASVLSDILRRCTLGGGSHVHMHLNRARAHERAPLRQLLDAAICAYVNTTHSRLAHISPRHYTDFVDFLSTAQHTFAMAPDGPLQFAALLDNMRLVYKGKKKLMALVRERFKI